MQQLLPGIDHRALLEELCAELASEDPPPAWEALARLRSIARQLTPEQWDRVAAVAPYGTVQRWAEQRGDNKPSELARVQEAHRRVRRGLPVVPERSHLQACELCAIQVKCYHPQASPAHVRLNVLACRIQRDVGREQATRMLLDQLSPKLKQYASRLRRQTGMRRDDALAEVQSVTIEGLMAKYDLGEVAFLTHWLFAPLRGWVDSWVRALTHREGARRARETFGVEGVPAHEAEDDRATTARTERARAVLFDKLGLTDEEHGILMAVLTGVGAGERRGDVLARWAVEHQTTKKAAAGLWRQAQDRLRRLT